MPSGSTRRSISEGDGALLGDEVRQVPDDAKFASFVAAVTGAFGDPTRREIFLYVRAHGGASAAQVAEKFSLHPNVARHHLNRLAAGGYLKVTTGRGAQPVGRPAQRFFAPEESPVERLLSKRDDLVVLLLREALDMLGQDVAEAMAATVGERYGRRLAAQMSPHQGQRSVKAAMHVVAEALTAHGFAAHAEDQGPTTSVVAERCPFGDARSTPPVLCALDRGLVRGLLAGLCGDGVVHAAEIVLSSKARGDASCGASA
ncbi:MAG: helix-turn-helix transcriptional regulator [Acidimicrobiales bacterium]